MNPPSAAEAALPFRIDHSTISVGTSEEKQEHHRRKIDPLFHYSPGVTLS
jgi:hypothetical protein